MMSKNIPRGVVQVLEVPKGKREMVAERKKEGRKSQDIATEATWVT